MGAITLRFTGWQENLINAMVEAGLVETKSEALRLALFKLAADYNLVDSSAILSHLQHEHAKKRLSDEEILEGIERAKQETVRR